MIWYIAAGSAAGGVARFLVSGAFQRYAAEGLPFGTLVVNVTGSLIVGFLIRSAVEWSAMTPELRALLITGFCGGYTTFSTFSYETIVLFQNGDMRRGMLYVFSSVALSLLGVLAGMALAREFIALRR